MITLLITAVIFIHSLMSASESAEESSSVLVIFDSVLQFLHLPNLLNGNSIRKLAHFTEFSVFGFFLSWTVHAYRDKFRGSIFMILFFLLAVPVTDETLQYFSIGRSAEVKDVLIDFSGALTGFLILAALCAIAAKKQKKTEIQ